MLQTFPDPDFPSPFLSLLKEQKGTRKKVAHSRHGLTVSPDVLAKGSALGASLVGRLGLLQGLENILLGRCLGSILQ